jgi:hypothetical protein
MHNQPLRTYRLYELESGGGGAWALSGFCMLSRYCLLVIYWVSACGSSAMKEGCVPMYRVGSMQPVIIVHRRQSILSVFLPSWQSFLEQWFIRTVHVEFACAAAVTAFSSSCFCFVD